MTRIAHLSDVHILDPRSKTQGARYRFATKFVSLGRSMDPTLRGQKLARALAHAKARGATHYVISGDLTEVGEPAEFEHLAHVLEDAALPPDSVTLVPGNHDAYTSPNAWSRALAGPLARFAPTSATAPGKIVDRGDVAFLPIDTSYFQTIARSSGEFTKRTAEIVHERAGDPALRSKALVLVVHHPPFHPHRVLRWIDGLRGGAEVLELMAKNPRLQLLHGHLHRMMDRILLAREGRGLSTQSAESSSDPRRAHDHEPREDAHTRFFGAAATCDASLAPSAHGDAKALGVRFYDVVEGEDARSRSTSRLRAA